MHSIFKTIIFIIFGLSSAYASIDVVQFDNPQAQVRYQQLIAQLRCLVCQNQNLADSNAELAKDLRRKTYEMVKQNKTDQQILDYMQQRYGDFVLYKPPFNLANSVLWLGPFILLFITLIVLYVSVKRRQKNMFGQANNERIQTLLKNTPKLD